MIEIYEENSTMKNAALATWQFCNELKIGDIIFAKKGCSEILGRGVVESEYEYDEKQNKYNHVRHVRWTHKGSWQLDSKFARKTLTDITQDTGMIEKLSALFTEVDEIIDDEPEDIKEYPSYTKEDFWEQVYMSEEDYNSLVGNLKNKKNIILQGTSGVGKTFAAKRLAYSIVGMKDIDRVAMVQFHQSYSYEDFIMGFRPTATGFELKKGAFFNMKPAFDTDGFRAYRKALGNLPA
jgi:5-methylcytosine-specific restriction protein B